MIDFTTSHYLSLRHASSSLRPWAQLTTGVPAALREPPEATALAADLARLTGTEAAVLAASTLHAFWDVFHVRSAMSEAAGTPGMAVYVDAATYPVAWWGVERAAGRGVPVMTVPHHDPGSLREILARGAGMGLQPVVVADGLCPGCGRSAPVAGYLQVCREFGGNLVLDDTQPLGVLGSPQAGSHYGRGGGGSLRHAQVGGPEIILASSLAKGFGVPLAVVGGAAGYIRAFRFWSETRMHSSPPSLAHLSAGARAVVMNQRDGERRRERLANLVGRFRRGVSDIGLNPSVGTFPIQSLLLPPWLDSIPLYGELVRRGIHAVLHRSQCLQRLTLSFVITAGHSPGDVDAAVAALEDCLARPGQLATSRQRRLATARPRQPVTERAGAARIGGAW